jgi:DNA-binding response OmpR family regulator
MAVPRRLRVLVLEDEWLIAEQIETALGAAGYDVVGPVGRVHEAMDLLKGQAIDAAVLDINVHDERSFTVAEKLAQDATPFVFLSGYSNLELPRSFDGRPMMQKPIDTARLCRCLEALVVAAGCPPCT